MGGSQLAAGVSRMAHWAIRGHYRWGRMETVSGTGAEDDEVEVEGSVGRVGLVQHLADSCLVFAVVVFVS